MDFSDLGVNLGLNIVNRTARVINRTGGALVVGGIYAFDLMATDQGIDFPGVKNAQVAGATAVPYVPGTHTDTQHPLSNIIAVATAHLEGWIFCVAQEAAADDAVTEVVVQGIVPVYVQAGSTWNAPQLLSATNAQAYAAAAADGIVTLALMLEDQDGTNANALCLFDGFQLNTHAG